MITSANPTTDFLIWPCDHASQQAYHTPRTCLRQSQSSYPCDPAWLPQSNKTVLISTKDETCNSQHMAEKLFRTFLETWMISINLKGSCIPMKAGFQKKTTNNRKHPIIFQVNDFVCSLLLVPPEVASAVSQISLYRMYKPAEEHLKKRPIEEQQAPKRIAPVKKIEAESAKQTLTTQSRLSTTAVTALRRSYSSPALSLTKPTPKVRATSTSPQSAKTAVFVSNKAFPRALTLPPAHSDAYRQNPHVVRNQIAYNTWRHVCSLVQKLVQRPEEFWGAALVPIHETRCLEVLDPMHRSGKELRETWWEEWMKSKPVENVQRENLLGCNFFDWLKKQSEASEIPVVRYISDVGERNSYKLCIEKGKFYKKKGRSLKPLHTPNAKQPHLVVVATHGRYVAPWDSGEFQHTTVGREPVAGAGSMVICEGELDTLTDKSGHFRCEGDAVCEMVNYLHHIKEVNMTHVHIIMGCVEEPFKEMRRYGGGHLLVPQKCYKRYRQLVLTSNILKGKNFFDYLDSYQSNPDNDALSERLVKFMAVERACAKRVKDGRIAEIRKLEKEWEERSLNKKLLKATEETKLN